MEAKQPTLTALCHHLEVKRKGIHKGILSLLDFKSSLDLAAGTSILDRILRTGFVRSSGQAVVEFTLVVLLLLVITWIPIDFGLAFYTGQLAQNVSREAARIAAADPNLAATTVSCTMPCESAPPGTALSAAAARMSPALLPGALISVALEPESGTNCNRLAQVSVTGNYTFFFFRLLQGVGVSSSSIADPAFIQRTTKMRWEHQPGCQA